MKEPVRRLFAGEFNRCTVTVQTQVPTGNACLLTPTGLSLGRLSVIGALTEVEGRAGDLVHARIADPTGAFALRSDWHRPEVAGILAGIEPPAFVAVTGSPILPSRAPTHPPVILPEAVAGVDRGARDTWVIATADATLDRLERVRAALSSGERDPLLTRTIAEYGITLALLRDLAGMVAMALESVERKGGPHRGQGKDPEKMILAFLASRQGEPVSLEEILKEAARHAIGTEAASRAVGELLAEGECYMPRKGFLRLV